METKTNTPTDAEIVEVLATKGMGWEFWTAGTTRFGKVNKSAWNPPDDLNAVREVEARLTEGQQDAYIKQLVSLLRQGNPHLIIGRFATRHADPRTCCVALWRVLEGSEYVQR